jgi:Ca2+-binding RTX toxin-like protein
LVATTQKFEDAGAGTVLASAAVDERVLALLRAVNSEAHPGKAALTKKGTLDVQGTDDDDVIRVRRSGEKVIVGINKLVQTFEMAKVKRIVVNAGKGDDAITFVGNLRRGYVNGGPGDDTIVGGDEDDVLTGGAGNDLIYGGRGNDRINGSGGKDTIFGEAGDDRLFGGAGNDALDGGPGADTIDGGEGADAMLNVTKEDVVVRDSMDSIVAP